MCWIGAGGGLSVCGWEELSEIPEKRAEQKRGQGKQKS